MRNGTEAKEKNGKTEGEEKTGGIPIRKTDEGMAEDDSDV